MTSTCVAVFALLLLPDMVLLVYTVRKYVPKLADQPQLFEWLQIYVYIHIYIYVVHLQMQHMRKVHEAIWIAWLVTLSCRCREVATS